MEQSSKDFLNIISSCEEEIKEAKERIKRAKATLKAAKDLQSYYYPNV